LGEVGPNAAPAVKCAAEIIAAEAEAPQKIDALRYLGKVGCTKCYPCVEEGLIAALDDCTEVVRYEAAKAIRATATEQCKCCQCTSCCTQKIYEKLYKVAYDTDSRGCPVECSTRVRRVARQALCMCGGPNVTLEEPEEPTPTEGPSGAPPAAAPPPSVPPPAPPAAAAAAAPTAKPSESASANAAPEKTAAPDKNESPVPVESATSAATSTPAPEGTKTEQVEQKTSASTGPYNTGPVLRIATDNISPPSANRESNPNPMPLPETPSDAPLPRGESPTSRPSPETRGSVPNPMVTPAAASMRVVEPQPAEKCKACGNDEPHVQHSTNRFRYSWQSSSKLNPIAGSFVK
jgi:hypothetical protein